MREIKFRAWVEKFKEMYTVKMIDLQKEIAYFDKYNYRSFYDIDLMEYTGLRDKNEKEIYEGDILKLRDNHGIQLVKYHDEWSAFIVESQKDTSVGVLGLYFDKEDFEIIGNAYENPELLGENK